MSGLSEDLKKSIEEMGVALTSLQRTADETKGRVDALDAEKMDKMGEDLTAAQKAVQDINAKFQSAKENEKKLITRLDDLEKALAKSKAGGEDEKVVSKYHQSLDTKLRSWNTASVSRDLVGDEATKMVKAFFPHLTDEGREKVSKALISGSNPDGGYWVPVDRLQTMITQIFETSPVRQLATTITTASNQVSLIIDDGEFTATWGNELSQPVNNDTPQVGELTISVHNLFARATITENMLEDASIDIVGWLSGKATDKFTRTENSAHVVGTGTNMPRGFLTYPVAADPDVYERGAVGVVQAANATEAGQFFGADDLFNIQNHVKEPYQPASVWGMKRRSFFPVAILKDAQGQYLLRMTSQVVTEAPMVLLGKPIVLMDDMPDIAANSLSFVYGNFRAGYTIVDRVGMTVLIDPYSEDPKIRYRFRKRTGGAVTNYEAFKILRSQASAGP